MTIHGDYFQFWSHALGLEVEQLLSLTPVFSSSGSYVERHGNKYIYLYTDLLSGKNIFAASPINMRRIIEHVSLGQLSGLNEDNVRRLSFLGDYKLEFEDIDYCLPKQGSLNFKARKSVNIRTLDGGDAGLLEDFYAQCSEDDKDTLDLRLEEDFALGHFHASGRLASVARFSPIPESHSLADLTVVTADSARGHGYASLLISELVREIQARGLIPKYRVGAENLASVSIARRLGLVAGFRIMSWCVEP
jgi:hypothetical protein